jgi:hypothetical protein
MLFGERRIHSLAEGHPAAMINTSGRDIPWRWTVPVREMIRHDASRGCGQHVETEV